MTSSLPAENTTRSVTSPSLRILACDPARFGDDRTVIGIRQGRHFRILAKLRGVDTVETASRVIAFIKEERPDAVIVDGDGLGAGVVDNIEHRGWGRLLYEFHGGARSRDPNKYFNRRSEIWGLMADALKAGMEIPDDPELEVDLCGPQYGFSNQNQIQLEKKEDSKRRGLASPDLADTLAMTFAEQIRSRTEGEWYDTLLRYRYRNDPPDAWLL